MTHDLAADFRKLESIPAGPQDVIWPDLEPSFHRRCIASLAALTEVCKSSTGSKLSFYVGAGISRFPPSSLPVASDVLTVLFEVCGEHYPTLEKPIEAILKVISGGAYVLMENVFQQVYESVHPRPFYSGRIFDVPAVPSRYNVNHAFLAHWLQSGRGTVVTTNLDPLIEHAHNAAARPIVDSLTVVKRPDEFDGWEHRIDQPNVLWKLHGSAEDPDSWAITLPKVGFVLQDARAGFIEYLIGEHNVCFVGYRAADLDLFPPILRAHTSRKANGCKIFWVFYFDKDRKTLSDYLVNEPNVSKLFEACPDSIYPIVTTAERLLTWIQKQGMGIESVIPHVNTAVEAYDYQEWLRRDLQAIGLISASKLVGFTLRTAGKHSKALAVFNQTTDLMAMQTAQLLQESAQTFWQRSKFAAARKRVEQSWRLLEYVDAPLARAWCQYGRVTMALDAKRGVSPIGRLIGTIRLFTLRYWFHRLSKHTPSETSPLLGEGLCLYYETKLIERICELLGFKCVRRIRKWLIRRYRTVEGILQKVEFLQSVPDIKRRCAFLLVVDDPAAAVQEMLDSVRIAQVISQSHYDLAMRRAKELINRIHDGTLRASLLSALSPGGQQGESLADTHG